MFMAFAFGVSIGQTPALPPTRSLFYLPAPFVRFNVAYGVGKAGVDRLVKDMATGTAQTEASGNVKI